MRKHLLLLMCVTFIWGCEKKGETGVSIRPNNFPSFLKAPESSVAVRYATAESPSTAEGVVSLMYSLDDAFPPKSAIEFVEKELSSAGFFRAKYMLQGWQQLEAGYVWQSNALREPGYIELKWIEDWISSSKNEFISVVFSYRYKAGDQIPNTVTVSLSYFTETAELSAYVKRYKELSSENDWRKDTSEIDYRNMP